MGELVASRLLTVNHRAGASTAGVSVPILSKYDTDAEDSFARATAPYLSLYWEAGRNEGKDIPSYAGAPTDNFDAVYSGASAKVFSGAGRLLTQCADGKLALVGSLLGTSFSATRASGSNVLTGVSSIAYLVIGQGISGTGIPGGATIDAIDAAAATVTLSVPATASGTSTLTAAALANDAGHAIVATTPLITSTEDWTILMVIEPQIVSGTQVILSTATYPALNRVAIKIATTGVVAVDNGAATPENAQANVGIANGVRSLFWVSFKASTKQVLIGGRNATPAGSTTWANGFAASVGGAGETIGGVPNTVGGIQQAGQALILMRAKIPAFAADVPELQTILDAHAVKFGGNGLN
jgi:hypothetical protein